MGHKMSGYIRNQTFFFFFPYFNQNIGSELGKAVEAGRGRSWKPYRQCLDANFKNYN